MESYFHTQLKLLPILSYLFLQNYVLISSFYGVSIWTSGVCGPNDSIRSEILGAITFRENFSPNFFFYLFINVYHSFSDFKRNDTPSSVLHSIIGVGFHILKQTQVHMHIRHHCFISILPQDIGDPTTMFTTGGTISITWNELKPHTQTVMRH